MFLEPTKETLIVEYNHQICFSKEAVNNCREGMIPERRNNNENYENGKKINFACFNRSSSQTRQLRRQVRNGEVVVINDEPTKFVETIMEPIRCVPAY